jgi:uncharacterized protein (TIGR02118 family)
MEAQVKHITLVTRNPSISQEALAQRWEERATQLARAVTPARWPLRMLQDLPVSVAGGELPLGGMRTVVVPDERFNPEHRRGWWQSEEAQSLCGVESDLMDPAQTRSGATHERVLKGRDRLFDDAVRREQGGAVKVVAFLKRRPDMSTAECCRYWEQCHAPLALTAVPADVFAYAYVQNHCIVEKGTEPDFDAVAELYFDDLKAVRRWSRWYASDDGAVLRADELNFILPDQRTILVTRERVLLP